MKKSVLIFLAGILIGALVFGSTLTLAASGTKNILAEYMGIKIVVNGKLLTTQQEPFISDGKTFVPLRVVAEALGQQVNWEDNTVIITGGNFPSALSLQDLFIPVKSGLKYSDDSKMMVNEKEYKKGFYLVPTDKAAECKFTTVSTGIKQLSGQVVLDDENEKGDTATVTILVDDKKVDSFELQKGSLPVPFQINVAKSNSIVFRVEDGVGKKVDFLEMVLKY